MGGTEQLERRLRDYLVELIIKNASKSGHINHQTRLVIESLANIVYATIVFIVDAAKSGESLDEVVVRNFVIGQFGNQFRMLGNKSADCVVALAFFATDMATLAPDIDAALGIGTLETASGLGAPLGLSVITAAAIASVYLTMEGISAINKCEVALDEAYDRSSKVEAGHTELKIDTKTLSKGSLQIFNFLVKRNPRPLRQCRL